MSISTTPVHLRKLLANYLRPWRARVVVLTVCLLASIGAQLVNPQMLRFFIDAAQRGDPARRLLQAAVIFLLIALVDQALSVVVTYLGQDVGWRATNRLRADLAAHCLRLDMPFHNTITPGELIERIDGDVTLLSNLFSTLVIRIFSGVLLVMGIILLLVREEPLAGLLFTGWVAVTFLWLYYTRRLAIPHVGAERQASAQLFGFIEERLGGLPDIKANGGVAYTLRRLRAVNDYLLQKGRQSWVMNSIGWSAASVALALGNALALGMGAFFYQQGHITLGTVYLFFHYSMLLFRPVEMLTRQLQDLQRAGAGLDRIRRLLAIRPIVVDGGALALAERPPAITFAALSFHYDTDEPVLRDIDFHLSAGRTLGLLGRTGSGKSTLARLLVRFYDPAAGAILLDGVDLRHIRLAEVRRRVGVVTQDVQVFAASVRDNLTLFDDRIPDERIAAVLDQLGMGVWLRRQPAGLDTLMEQGSVGISAGEAQLLAFARVFLKEAQVVVLDEASSRLDPATERLMDRAVSQLLHERTGIIIAHRLATVQRVDDILILQDGRIAEHGSRQRLAASPASLFSRLLRTGLEDELA